MNDLQNIDINNFIKNNLYGLSKDEVEKYENVLKLHVETVYGNVISKYIKANYLSHWKSSIENLINERRKCLKEELKLSIQKGEYSDLKELKYNFRMYSIELIESKKKLKVPAQLLHYEGVSIILYNNDDTEKIRFGIAHELGHIIIDILYPEYGLELNEKDIEFFAHFWACFIIHDKSEFYKAIANDYKYKYNSFEDIDNKISKLYN